VDGDGIAELAAVGGIGRHEFGLLGPSVTGANEHVGGAGVVEPSGLSAGAPTTIVSPSAARAEPNC